jgi:cytoskeletal protein RodZ
MSTSIGQQLREARQAKSLSLEQVSRITHIRPHLLEALEAGNLDALPSITQARGFLRAYSLHLGLDPDTLLAGLGADEPVETDAPPIEVSSTETFAVNIYKEIGDRLRLQRETLGVTIDEAENQTRLRRYHIEALERGDIEQLPSPVQGRGMLHNYAAFLGLDPEPLLLKYAEGLQAQLEDRRTFTPPRNGRPRRSLFGRFVSGDLLFGGIFLLALIVFVIWAVGRVSSTQDSIQGQATAPAIVDMLDPLPTETPIPTFEPTVDPLADTPEPELLDLEENPTVVPTEPILSNDPVQVYIVVMERAWIRITVDGAIEFEGRVIPGSAYPFSGRQRITVFTSSGSALEIFYNQEDQGPMGLVGQIVERIYTPNDILVPTPVESPTPTPTNTPTLSPEETPNP